MRNRAMIRDILAVEDNQSAATVSFETDAHDPVLQKADDIFAGIKRIRLPEPVSFALAAAQRQQKQNPGYGYAAPMMAMSA